MYMREMGTVELLTREGEIKIARRIEERSESGHEFARALSRHHAPDHRALHRDPFEEETKLSDLVVGFVDPEEDPNTIPLPAAAQNTRR